ncbi:MAG: APC family permease [Parvibaculaceae bacterium]
MTDPVLPEPYETPLARRLNLPLLVLYGLGVTVGAGIYVLIGEIGHRAGIFAPYAFILAGVLMAPTTYSFSQLVIRFPVSAGEARYVEEGFGLKWLALLVGLLVASAGVISSATITAGSVGYIQQFVAVPGPVLIIFIVASFMGIAIIGIKESITFAAILTLIEIGGLVAIIAGGFLSDLPAVAEGLSAPVAAFDLTAFGLIASVSVLTFFAFTGFEDMVNVGEEVQEPEKIFPLAIALTLGVTMLLYFLVSTVAVSIAAPHELGNSDAPITLLAEKTGLLSPALLSLIGMLSALNGILIQLIMSSRVVYGLSRQAELPKVFSYVHPNRRTPVTATFMVGAVVLTLALTFPLAGLAETTSRVTFVIFTLVNSAYIAIRLREGASPFASPRQALDFAIPASGAIGTVLLMVFSFG